MRVILFVFLLISIGCSTNKTAELESSTLNTGYWKLISWESDQPIDFNDSGETNTDVLSQLDACYQNVYYYISEKNNNYYYGHVEFGDTTCSDYNNSIYFSINEKTKNLEITQKYGGPLTFKFLQLNEDYFKLEAYPLWILNPKDYWQNVTVEFQKVDAIEN